MSETPEDETFDDVSVQCLFCMNTFPEVGLCLAHMRTDHLFNMKQICYDWELDFYDQIKLINFIRRCVDVTCICPYCLLSFSNKDSLYRHLQVSPETALPVYPPYLQFAEEDDDKIENKEDEPPAIIDIHPLPSGETPNLDDLVMQLLNSDDDEYPLAKAHLPTDFLPQTLKPTVYADAAAEAMTVRVVSHCGVQRTRNEWTAEENMFAVQMNDPLLNHAGSNWDEQATIDEDQPIPEDILREIREKRGELGKRLLDDDSDDYRFEEEEEEEVPEGEVVYAQGEKDGFPCLFIKLPGDDVSLPQNFTLLKNSDPALSGLLKKKQAEAFRDNDASSKLWKRMEDEKEDEISHSDTNDDQKEDNATKEDAKDCLG
ncbi:hypothetical protein BLNAU_5647 [Blattamonas nauphoetae]|uniref:ZN622/Rei1/Reh1 zinc finger C2H2-type domain-containing protein n=1 Tax=Blattamonas nauphoetae TaxID=2049346 RepID=A0ABQ9Y6E4_9EUKA|nr:hypothetical protein BLNAU_5647 [Blattamonas nauphoetae]